jgi:hypothetical protein
MIDNSIIVNDIYLRCDGMKPLRLWNKAANGPLSVPQERYMNKME